MTAFSPSQIPATVDTLEKLIVWANAAFHSINSTLSAVEADGSNQRIATNGVFFISNNNTSRCISRSSIPMASNWQAANNRIWQNAQDVSSTAIPSSMTA